MTTDTERATPAETRALRWFFLLAFVLLAAGLGLRDPWPSDEPRFTLVARQMVESGDWLFPHRGTELYADKPPMMMWLEAIAYELTRTWRIAFLLPSLVASLLTLGLTYDLGRRLWNRRVGLYAAGTVLFAFQFMYQMKRAQIDPLITCFITLANWGLLRHCLRGPDWRAYWLGCFAAGLGVITKGVGVLALLMLLPYAYARAAGWPGVAQTARSALRWSAGALAFLLPILLWLVPMLLVAQARGTPEYDAYVNDILFKQTAKRYADSWSHVQPFWYYLPILLFNWFPVSLAYAGAIPRWWRDLKARDPRLLMTLGWTLMIVVFFSIPRGKRDVYLLPALPMVALAIAPYLEEMLRTRWLRTTAFAIALLGGLVIVGAGGWTLHGTWKAANSFLLRRELVEEAHAVVSLVVAIGAGFVAAALWFRPARGVHALLTGIAGLWLLWSFGAYPILNDSSSARGVMRRAGEMIGPERELGLVGWKEQNMLMADRPTMDFGFKAPLPDQLARGTQWLAQAPERRRLFVLEKAMGDCVDRSLAAKVGHANRRDWWLVGMDAIKPGCVPGGAAEDDADDAGDGDGG